ncbi:LIM homeobox transcription factor 1-beta [Phlebotomus argentipes]|uniref:LIM homeobox transcription factor 1-beta n=1 Tax=Phlebotomus argentipes TaxID=94469 RepID=UPI00289320EC|nr:LIM homeobox transcription factor 1-beta [Phlebotomus argentipes]
MLSYIPMDVKCPEGAKIREDSPLCGMCCRPICDRYIMQVAEMTCHESCLCCSSCSGRLRDSCFSRDGKLFCRIDYERLFVKNKCLACAERISSDEFVMRTDAEDLFHLKCFVCVVCGVQLQKGDHYVLKQGQLFCRIDYEKEVEMLQSISAAVYNDPEDFSEDFARASRRGPKRPRTILTTQQRRAFKACFDVSPRPCRKTRESLANDTGLSLRIVQVWFQNQRAKMKKMEKKEKCKGESADEEEDKAKKSSRKIMTQIKDDPQSDNDSLTSGASAMSPGEENFIKMEPPRPDLMSNDTDQMMRDQVASFHSMINQFNSGHAGSFVNPIDRLYSMQNLYFFADDEKMIRQ